MIQAQADYKIDQDVGIRRQNQALIDNNVFEAGIQKDIKSQTETNNLNQPIAVEAP